MSINKASSTTSSMEMTWTTNRKAACRRTTQVEVVIEEEVMQYTSKLMEKAMQQEIDDLKKWLRRAQRKQTPLPQFWHFF